MRAVDTNLVVRLVTRDDEAQVEIAETFIEGGAWVSHLVLQELAWVLSDCYGLDDAEIAVIITMLLEHTQLVVQDADVVAAALDDYRRRPSLGFSDCLILAVARKAGHLPLGTFDKDLGKLEGALRLTPSTRGAA